MARGGKFKHTQLEVDVWIQMYESGATINKISSECKSSWGTTRRYLLRAGVKLRRGGFEKNPNWPTEEKSRRKDSALRSTYGITFQDFSVMLEKQNGVCAVCFRPPSMGSLQTSCLHVDHEERDDGAVIVRGLLCNRCNTSIGILGDTVESIEHVLRYLKGELT